MHVFICIGSKIQTKNNKIEICNWFYCTIGCGPELIAGWHFIINFGCALFRIDNFGLHFVEFTFCTLCISFNSHYVHFEFHSIHNLFNSNVIQSNHKPKLQSTPKIINLIKTKTNQTKPNQTKTKIKSFELNSYL